MSSLDEKRTALLQGVVQVVSDDGLENATTKSIACKANINESYIYRCFENKEDMLSETFSDIDQKWHSVIFNNIWRLHIFTLPRKERCWKMWLVCWNFLLSDPEKCRFYIRYYYSQNFRKYDEEYHRQNVGRVLRKLNVTCLVPDFESGVILSYLFDTMLNFALKIVDGNLENNEKTAEKVFDLIYDAAKPYMRPDQLNEAYRPAAMP